MSLPLRASKHAVRLRWALGALWLFDGLLQLAPSNFTPDFFGSMLRMNMSEPPGWLWDLESVIEPFVTAHASAVNALCASVQLAIGFGLFFRCTTRLALGASVPWALCVWLFGESLGGLFGPGASALTGAPGAALLYALAALILWPDATDAEPHGRTLRVLFAELSWVALWLGTAALEAGAMNRVPFIASSQIAGLASGQPAFLAVPNDAIASLIGAHGVVFAAVVGSVQTAIGLGVLSVPTRRAALIAGMTLGAFYGFVGQDLGGIFGNGFTGVFTSGATDPGDAPIIVLLGLSLWCLRPAALLWLPGPTEALTSHRFSTPRVTKQVQSLREGPAPKGTDWRLSFTGLACDKDRQCPEHSLAKSP